MYLDIQIFYSCKFNVLQLHSNLLVQEVWSQLQSQLMPLLLQLEKHWTAKRLEKRKWFSLLCAAMVISTWLHMRNIWSISREKIQASLASVPKVALWKYKRIQLAIVYRALWKCEGIRLPIVYSGIKFIMIYDFSFKSLTLILLECMSNRENCRER